LSLVSETSEDWFLLPICERGSTHFRAALMGLFIVVHQSISQGLLMVTLETLLETLLETPALLGTL